LNEIQQLEIVIDDWICFGPKRNIFDCYWCFPRYQDAEFLVWKLFYQSDLLAT
jgi:hypothetical protein